MRRARFLRYAAIQFIVLVAGAMVLYAGGTYYDPETSRYELTGNFLSDLGAIHAWSGRSNLASSALFFVALASLGGGLVAFAWTWRHFAFARERARHVGHASSVLGTASGLCFVGVASAPFDLALTVHNACVIGAFGLLLCYVACMTFVMARNGASRTLTIANLAYLACVMAYVGLVLFGPRLGTMHGHHTQVIGQKLIVSASIVHIIFLTSAIRRPA